MKKEKQPKFPIYIPSKGRAHNQKTVKLLESQGLTNYFVVIEPQDFIAYSQFIDSKKLIKLSKNDYGTSSPARNMCITHSKKNGYDMHWQFDDDISKVYKHNLGKVVHSNLKKILLDMEGVVLNKKHKDVDMAGISTSASFLKSPRPEFTYNTSLTSFFLIRNTDVRFRLRMCVDLDYLLQVLNKGKDTLKFNKYAFVFVTSLKSSGGYYSHYSNNELRDSCLLEFLKHHPEVEPGLKETSRGFKTLKNIGKVWRLFKHRINERYKN